MRLTKENIGKYFQSIHGQEILVIGDVMLDEYIEGEVSRISPEAPVPVVNIRNRKKCLGGAANVALNLSAMGASPILCGIIGQDSKGFDFLRHMELNQLPQEGIVRSEERPTTTKIRIIGNKMQLLRVDEENDAPLSETDARNLQENILKLLRERPVQAVIFEDYDKGAICPELIEAVTKQTESLHIPICVDPKKRNFSAYRNISLFKPNLSELAEGLQIPKSALRETGKLREHVFRFMEEKGHRMVMTTLSENGLMLCSRLSGGSLTSTWIPAIVRNICDVSGAGDTVISIATLGMITGLPVEQMAEMANIAGGLVCETVGVVPIDKAMLEKECGRLLF
jgi:rfaE bifunctional protein kinase chain/domain